MPRQNLIRELLDHVIVLNEDHLLRLLREFIPYYHEDTVRSDTRKPSFSSSP